MNADIILLFCKKINAMKKLFITVTILSVCFSSCELKENNNLLPEENKKVDLHVEQVAGILAKLPINSETVNEVFDAVSSSSGNGYDDEYTMKNLFESPGTGVGETLVESRGAAKKHYSKPLKEMLKDYLKTSGTKASGSLGISVEDYLNALQKSDLQIYWPYYDSWDGKELPIITYDPMDGSSTNVGYKMVIDKNGEKSIKEVIVDEKTAEKSPVWVINKNDDCNFSSIEILRRKNPNWGIVGGGSLSGGAKQSGAAVRSSTVKSLVLKDFTMHRNYDSWFAGASEFFVKCGAIENFSASTEAELRLYQPSITDFMVVVKRSQMDKKKEFNVLLVSDWQDALENCAFMITEDDGGTRTNWKCSATVKVKSKSFGFDISIPFNSHDDIVWRGMLSKKYFEKYSGVTSKFGDVSLTFALVEH